MNDLAVNQLEKINQGQSLPVAEHMFYMIGDVTEEYKEKIKKGLGLFKKDMISPVYYSREKHVIDGNSSLADAQKEALRSFMRKYQHGYEVGNFSKTGGHTAFFYGSPNNLLPIIWNSQMVLPHEPKRTFKPLLHRTEDLSLYDMAKDMPSHQQIW